MRKFFNLIFIGMIIANFFTIAHFLDEVVNRLNEKTQYFSAWVTLVSKVKPNEGKIKAFYGLGRADYYCVSQEDKLSQFAYKITKEGSDKVIYCKDLSSIIWCIQNWMFGCNLSHCTTLEQVGDYWKSKGFQCIFCRLDENDNQIYCYVESELNGAEFEIICPEVKFPLFKHPFQFYFV